MLNLLRRPREPKLHARMPEPWLRHRYARFSDMLTFCKSAMRVGVQAVRSCRCFK